MAAALGPSATPLSKNGTKAAFETFVLVKDVEWSKRLARFAQLGGGGQPHGAVVAGELYGGLRQLQRLAGLVVQIACEEAGVSHGVIAMAAQSPANRHPFGKVPVVEVDGLELIESVAITQYIDNAHNGGALQPADPAQRRDGGPGARIIPGLGCGAFGRAERPPSAAAHHKQATGSTRHQGQTAHARMVLAWNACCITHGTCREQSRGRAPVRRGSGNTSTWKAKGTKPDRR